MSSKKRKPIVLMPYHIYSGNYRDVKQNNVSYYTYTNKYFFIVYRRDTFTRKKIWVLIDNGTLTLIDKPGMEKNPIVKNIKLESEMNQDEIKEFDENIKKTIKDVGDLDPDIYPDKINTTKEFMQQLLNRRGITSIFTEDKFPQTAEYIAKRQESDNMKVSFGKKRLKKFKVDSDIIYLKSL